jgi:hypothetical protein
MISNFITKKNKTLPLLNSFNSHSFRVGAALDLLEQGEPLEGIMLRGGWQTDTTAMKYLGNWIN